MRRPDALLGLIRYFFCIFFFTSEISVAVLLISVEGKTNHCYPGVCWLRGEGEHKMSAGVYTTGLPQSGRCLSCLMYGTARGGGGRRAVGSVFASSV